MRTAYGCGFFAVLVSVYRTSTHEPLRIHAPVTVPLVACSGPIGDAYVIPVHCHVPTNGCSSFSFGLLWPNAATVARQITTATMRVFIFSPPVLLRIRASGRFGFRYCRGTAMSATLARGSLRRCSGASLTLVDRLPPPTMT